MMEIYGNIVDVFQNQVYPGCVTVEKGVIVDLRRVDGEVGGYILPGFVDSHIHIESSMLTPSNFAVAAVRFGTVATVSDPHEIANVLGVPGVEFMIRDGRRVPLKFHFGAPSCVPATNFETSGASLGPEVVGDLLKRGDIYFLSEMMNFPGVVHGDGDVLRKLEYAKNIGKPIDGHAPGLTGDALARYTGAGISTDHECSTYEEAKEKIENGMIIQIREGSAARNFENLYRLIDEYPDRVMLCSDDLHPDDLVNGHLNRLLAKGVSKGLNVFNLVKAISKNPVEHYGLNVGLLQKNGPADFVVVNDLVQFNVKTTFIDGVKVYHDGQVGFESGPQETPNAFYINKVSQSDLSVPAGQGPMKVIDVTDGELITKRGYATPKIVGGVVVPDLDNDILKIVVVNRYANEKPAVGFIKNMGLKYGAMASSIAHDSHNIIAVGTDDRAISEVIAWIQEEEGGVAFHDGTAVKGLSLPVAGIMSAERAETTADKYSKVQKLAKEAGSELKAPFMSLSFMALLVIPELKIGDRGLFDVGTFSYTTLFDNK